MGSRAIFLVQVLLLLARCCAGLLHSHGGRGTANVSCAVEEALRKAISDSLPSGRIAPTIMRFVFHDAVDANNLLAKNKETEKWDPVPGEYGGVDLCLYSPLSEGTHGSPQPSHNRNLQPFGFAAKICKALCAKSPDISICQSPEDCAVDMTVFGSIVMLENVGGPRVPMTWGRKKGPCKSIIETPFAKDPEKLKTYDEFPALRTAPSFTGIDNATDFRDSFQRLGFGPVDQAALMGAHTFGKLQVCAGGLNGIEHGPFCNAPEKLDPPITDKNMYPDQCKPEVGVVGNCWAKVKGSKLTPVYATAGKIHGHGFKNGFGDGGFFDRTPEKFDNDYYKLFAEETYEGKDDCCGKIKGTGCHRGGTMVRITERLANGKPSGKKKTIAGGACGVNWCRSDRKGRTHMKSTKAWHEASHDFVKKGYHHGVTKRMIRLPGDWALLGHPETKAAVKQFADSEDAFFGAFITAWGKVIEKGYTGLKRCSAGGQAPDLGIQAQKKKKTTTSDVKDKVAEVKKDLVAKVGTTSAKGVPFQGPPGCKDKHKKCHLLKGSNKAKKCKGGKWLKRCPFSCGTCDKPEQ